MQQAHQHFSAACFNDCWNYIDKKDRSPDDIENMILLANASVWHWKQRTDCQPMNLSVGYWQLSRVYALAGNFDLAQTYANQCLSIGIDNSLPPFYIGYAYEALARVAFGCKEVQKANILLKEAFAELEKISEPEEKSILETDLKDLQKSCGVV